MIYPTPIFVAFLAAIRCAGVVSFAAVPLPPSSSSSSSSSLYRRGHVSGRLSQAPAPPMRSTTTHSDIVIGVAGADAMVSMPRRVRWRSRLAASGETLGGASEEESDSPAGVEGAVNASTAGGAPAAAGGAGVDLAKGIAFEAPKPKTLEPEEEESESKKIRVILYTVLSLVPFVLLLPFLGSRELLPLDPSQM